MVGFDRYVGSRGGRAHRYGGMAQLVCAHCHSVLSPGGGVMGGNERSNMGQRRERQRRRRKGGDLSMRGLFVQSRGEDLRGVRAQDKFVKNRSGSSTCEGQITKPGRNGKLLGLSRLGRYSLRTARMHYRLSRVKGRDPGIDAILEANTISAEIAWSRCEGPKSLEVH